MRAPSRSGRIERMIFLTIVVLAIVALLLGRLDLAVIGCLVACLYLVLVQTGALVVR